MDFNRAVHVCTQPPRLDLPSTVGCKSNGRRSSSSSRPRACAFAMGREQREKRARAATCPVHPVTTALCALNARRSPPSLAFPHLLPSLVATLHRGNPKLAREHPPVAPCLLKPLAPSFGFLLPSRSFSQHSFGLCELQSTGCLLPPLPPLLCLGEGGNQWSSFLVSCSSCFPVPRWSLIIP